ncbi:TonB-dependent receptor plug domain-containing protein [Paraflavisolibacter sp. H34]|uniref:TonB-dependent receptor n=1 Tax=Huijunlia imazamoxiresistens TaxID=3127457 RepID=UPI0030170EC8
MKRINLFLGMMVSCTSLFAQQETDRKDTVDLTPVEVRAIRAGSLAPFTKTNLSKADIEKQNLGQDLPFLLNQTPSTVVSSDAGTGIGYTGLRIRGTDLTRINVTLNGIPYNDAESQGVFFVDLPDFASSVSSLQIQRGVGTSSNGAGAFGATINLSTNELNTLPYVELNNSFGSFNTWKHTLKAGTGLLNNHFTVDARLSKISSDGFIDRATSDLQSFYVSGAWLNKGSSLRLNVFSGKEKTFQAWNGIPQHKLFYNADSLLTHYYNNLGSLYFTPEDSANLFSANSRRYNGFLYPNQTDNYRQDHYQLFFNQDFANHLTLSTALFLTQGEGYYEEFKYDQKYSSYGLPDQTIGGSVFQRTNLVRQLWLKNNLYGGVFSLQYKKNAVDYTVGGSWNRFDGDHIGKIIWAGNAIPKDFEWYHYPAKKDDGNLYAKMGVKWGERLYLLADLQYRQVRHRITGTRKFPDLKVDKTFGFFNPKLGLNYTGRNFTAYASYAQAHKEPTRNDFETGAALQAPKAEQLHDFEAGIEHAGTKARYGATAYYMLYKDQLVQTGKLNDVGDAVRINAPDSYRLGLEAWGGVQLNKWLSLQGNVTISRNIINHYTDYVARYDAAFDFAGYDTLRIKNAQISFSPWLTAAGSVSIKPVRRTELLLTNKAVSKQYLDNTNSDAKQLKGYFVQDAQLRYTLSNKTVKAADIIVQVNNLWNRKYETNGYTYSYYYDTSLIRENFYYPMAGTNFTIGLNIKL